MKFGLIFVAFLIVFVSSVFYVYADEYDDINKQLSDLKNSLSSSQKATATNEKELGKLNAQFDAIKNQVGALQAEIYKKEKEVKEGEKQLGYQKSLLDQRAISYYKNLKNNSLDVVDILVSENISESLQNFFYQKSLQEEDRRAITKVVLYVKNLEEKKSNLESQQVKLNIIKLEVDKQAKFLAGEVMNAKKFQGELNKKIADLSARQQEIVNSRSGSSTFNMGDVGLSGDSNASLNWFKESAPGGSFGVFAFGAHTHRKGMSQYGARGRAQSGQNYKEILKKYFGKEPEGKDTGGNLKVAGYGEIDFETTYLYGIAEMPSSWHPEALKAQAVAARSYAYRYKQDGKEICTNEACQVFNKGKSDNPPDAWKQAVDGTKGQVLEGVVTYYSSTTGGYLTTSGWDTTDGGGGGGFLEKTFEKQGGSPWLYKAWYTQSYSVSSDTCGRSAPWLSAEEMADIVNAALVLTKGNSEEASRITPVTTSCWGGNPYSHEELRNIASKYGGISSANSVSVSQGDGSTSNVTINGISFSGTDFKRAFNLRAPGYTSIPQYQFAFFNIEKK